MTIRFALLAALALSSAASAQTAPTAAPTPVAPAAAPVAGEVLVRIDTALGPVVVALDTVRAPITSANFLRYVDGERLDGAVFYRAMQTGGGTGLVQGGAQGEAARVLPAIAHEPTSRTGIVHGDGTISMARHAPGTATGDFFITVGPASYLDADPAKSGDNAGFAAFGRVVEGMDVVRAILAAPTSPTKGEGVMRGQMIERPVRIATARRVRPPAN